LIGAGAAASLAGARMSFAAGEGGLAARIAKAQAFRFVFDDPPLQRQYFLLKLTTDEGLVGWGEALALGQAEDDELASRLLAMGRFVEGRDAAQIESILEDAWYGSGFDVDGLQAAAVSALDGALHDLEGKRRKVPVSELLGGAKRDRIEVYYTGFAPPSAEVQTPKQLVEAAKQAAAEGYRNLKWDPFVFAYMLGQGLTPQQRSEALAKRVTLESANWANVEEQFRLVREAVGPEVELIIEAHGRLRPAAAIETAKRLAKFKPRFFESPVHHFDVEGTARVSEATEIPIAQGDILYRVEGFRGLAATKACEILRPDVAHCGGMREAMKIAALAKESGLTIAPHCTAGPVGVAMSLHYSAAIENFVIMEFLPKRDLAMQDQMLVRAALEVEKGMIAVPKGPGLGVDVREDVLSEVQ
jgi:galactonate dehydratase